MALLHLEALPPRTTKGTIVRLLTQVGEMDKQRIGKVELAGRTAIVEVPASWAARLARTLDGARLDHQHIRAWHDAEGSTNKGEDHFGRLLRLLDIESEAEAQQLLEAQRRLSPTEAEQSGASLIHLAMADEQPGLGGRLLVTLRKKSQGPLPWTRLGIGAPVLLSEESGDESWRGVVCDRTMDAIEIALAASAEIGRSGSYRVDLSSDEVARQRQRLALECSRAAHGDRLAALRQILLGESAPALRELLAPQPYNDSLDAAQRAAVQLALTAADLALIHGPPGTGKTTTLVEVIRQAVRRGEKVLACAPSNLAVDNLFERILAAGERAVRLGHPARVLPELRAHTLDLMVQDHPDMQLARKLTREASALFHRAARFTRAKPAPGEKRQMREEAKQILVDVRRMERQVVDQILDGADVLCCTLTGQDSELLGQRRFDLAVIDEACQTTEPACWIPLARSQRVILAGDHCQLPPTVVAREALAEGFGVSLFERLMALHGTSAAHRLSVQYRMHEQIMAFSSDQFYDGSLVAHASVRKHLLCDLPDVSSTELTSQPVEFIDTAGAGYDEEREPDGESRLNPAEAELIRRRAHAFLNAGLLPRQIAVIAPYAAQVRLLRKLLPIEQLEVDTVDGFQGREKEAVLISLVRSNAEGEIGFLADERRMNVALTRARRKLLVVGDSATVGSHPFYQRLLDYFELIGAYRTVWEEPEVD